MNVIETETELFDLFGETGTCAICYEDLQDGERVRAIRKCQHLFHTTCIDPWLLRKAECPMCRTGIGINTINQIDISGASAASNALRTHLNNAYGYPTDSIASLNNLLNTIETLINNRVNAQNTPLHLSSTTSENNTLVQALPTAVELAPLRRYIVAFCLADGILRRHPTAASFNTARIDLHNTLVSYIYQGIRPVHLDFSNRTSLEQYKKSYRAEILRRLNVGSRTRIYNQEEVASVYDSMRGSTVLSNIWSA